VRGLPGIPGQPCRRCAVVAYSPAFCTRPFPSVRFVLTGSGARKRPLASTTAGVRDGARRRPAAAPARTRPTPGRSRAADCRWTVRVSFDHPPVKAPGPMTTPTTPLLNRTTCPHCWHSFSPESVLWVSSHTDLLGDPRLGPEQQQRFLPTRFDVAGNALGAHGMPCLGLACPKCHLPVPRALLEMGPFFVSQAPTKPLLQQSFRALSGVLSGPVNPRRAGLRQVVPPGRHDVAAAPGPPAPFRAPVSGRRPDFQRRPKRVRTVPLPQPPPGRLGPPGGPGVQERTPGPPQRHGPVRQPDGQLPAAVPHHPRSVGPPPQRLRPAEPLPRVVPVRQRRRTLPTGHGLAPHPGHPPPGPVAAVAVSLRPDPGPSY
jgi:hypothetical protein